MPTIVVLTSDSYLWALRPFAYLFNRYWSEQQKVVVGGYSRPPFQLPPNFFFHSIDRVNYPPEMWSDGLIRLLSRLHDDHFILMLEDYWLFRTVDVRGVAACYDYMRSSQSILRCDLTADRLYAGGVFDVESYGSYDVIETPNTSPYQFSTQAGIWNRRLLLDLLVPGKTGWDTEIYTHVPASMRVIGTRQWPVRYANAILKGKADHSQLAHIPAEHMKAIQPWFPPGW